MLNAKMLNRQNGNDHVIDGVVACSAGLKKRLLRIGQKKPLPFAVTQVDHKDTLSNRMLDPLLRTAWKDVRQAPYEIISTEQETGKPYSIHTKA